MTWFTTEFTALTGNEPYPWQYALFSELVAGHAPANLNMPTGAGKTSIIPIWLLAFIKNPLLPRRLAYVVDRRSVVDQATLVVEKMVAKMSPELKAAFAPLTLEGESVLGVSTLRGELADNEEWSRFPFRPSVTVGTVDKVGSALLFSSYGDGAYGRAKRAGLLGNDALVIFDECHLVPAFETLLKNVEAAGGKLKRFYVMTMSATSTAHDSLSLTDADLANGTLATRLNAPKTLSIVDAVSVPVKLTSLALKNPTRRTIVFVRSPRTAAMIADDIRVNHQNVACLTGTMRGKERDELADNPVFKAFTTPDAPAEPHFLVATSAGEVGVDLTCDRMLTDMSSAASLVQRFGRCNRFAESKSAEITVVYKTLEIAKFGQGKDLAFIVSLNGDASCANLYSKRSELAALAKVKPCPTLDPALLDILSMTSLKHDIDISNYLRGKDTSVRYCDIAWREEVPLLTKLNKYDFESYMRAMPVLGFETVSDTPKRVKEVLEVVSTTAECIVIMPEGERVVRTVAGLQDMPLRDSLILLPPHVGGLAGGMFSDHNRDAVALDIATIEHKNHPARQRILVAVDAVPMLPKNEKEVFNRTVKGMTLIVRKPKVVQSGKAVLLSLHHSAVAGTANDFATRCGLDAEIVAALTKAGEMHDVGKMNPIWQIAACGKMNNPPLAKSGGVFKNPTALDGLRHEFESLAAVAHGNQICQHVIASHHAGGRPCWAGTKNLSPVNRDGDAVLAQINRFAQLQAQLGWWGLAYVEAVFRCADAYASEEGE